MILKLTIYTDDTLTEVKRTAVAERLKIPYRVANYVAESLDGVNGMSQDDLFNFVINSMDKVDKIIKATFGVTDEEMECLDLMEMGMVGVEIYKWALDKINSLKGKKSKNVAGAAPL